MRAKVSRSTQVDVAGVEQVTAQAHDAAGNALTIRARYFVDASGRDTLLGNALKLKRKNDKHQSAAIFAHFRGVEHRPGEDAGNISIYNFQHGWCWFIPLREGVMSVGCVCWPEYLKQRRGRNEAFLLDTLKTMPDAWARMTAAEMISEVRVTGNYSYTLLAHGRAGLGHGRRCVCVRRSGVLVRRLSCDAQRQAGRCARRCDPARAGARSGAAGGFHADASGAASACSRGSSTASTRR